MRNRIMCMYRVLFCIMPLFAFCLCGCSGQTEQVPDKQEEIVTDENTSEIIEEIHGRGYLLAGCKTDVPDLSFMMRRQIHGPVWKWNLPIRPRPNCLR